MPQGCGHSETSAIKEWKPQQQNKDARQEDLSGIQDLSGLRICLPRTYAQQFKLRKFKHEHRLHFNNYCLKGFWRCKQA
jgi:hypothetical protein